MKDLKFEYSESTAAWHAHEPPTYEERLICYPILPLIMHMLLPVDSGHFLLSVFHPSIWEVKFR